MISKNIFNEPPRTCSPLIFALSANISDGDRMVGVEAGFDDMSKSFH